MKRIILALAASILASPAMAQRLPFVVAPGTPAEVVAAERFTRDLAFMVFNGAVAEHCGQRPAQWRRLLMEGARLEIRDFAARNGTAYLSREAIVFLGIGKISIAGEFAAEQMVTRPLGDCSAIIDEASLGRADNLVGRFARQQPRR
jgi:hypothetical protein